jgi:filamentous hemagglutinin family protein
LIKYKKLLSKTIEEYMKYKNLQLIDLMRFQKINAIFIRNKIFLIICFILVFPLSSLALDQKPNEKAYPHGITADGFATSVSYNNSEFTISGGVQKGNNLFFSFEKFNIHNGEQATFVDHDMVNTIGRITGGDSSWINGTIKSSAANLYLLNPSGFMFGPSAKLNLKGSFHVTTADYLEMEDNNRLYCNKSEESTFLSLADPVSFGFLDNDNQFGTISMNQSTLELSKEKKLSIISEKVNIDNSEIKASQGQINISCVSSPTEIAMNHSKNEDIQMNNMNEFSLTNESLIDVNGDKAGEIYIRCGTFVVNNSNIEAQVEEVNGPVDNNETGIIDIRAEDIQLSNGATIDATTKGYNSGVTVRICSEKNIHLSGWDDEKNSSKIILETFSKDNAAGNGGALFMEAENDIIFEDGAYISSFTFGKGNAGNVDIRSGGKLVFSGINEDSHIADIFKEAFKPFLTREKTAGGIYAVADPQSNGGNGGNIYLEADELLQSDGCPVYSASIGQGRGGDITIKVKNRLSLEGAYDKDFWSAAIAATALPVATVSGDSGDVYIEAGELSIKGGGYIASSTISIFGQQSGAAGKITLLVDGKIEISGMNKYGKNDIVGSSGIYVYSKERLDDDTNTAGEGGNIEIKANSLTLLNGGKITVTTSGKSVAGQIDIELKDSLSISGDSINEPYIKENEDDVSNLSGGLNYYRSGIYASSFGSGPHSGKGGDINISAKSIDISNKGMLTTSTAGGGSAGNISIETNELNVNSGSISSESTSTDTGGNSGEILIHAANIHFMNGASISGDVHGSGNGENIRIESDKSVVFEGEDADKNISRITIETRSQNENAGDGGTLQIIAGKDVIFKDGAYISSFTFGKGDAGDIHINATGDISFSGVSYDQHLAGIFQNSFGIKRKYTAGGIYAIADSISNGGNGGNVNLEANRISLLDGCPIFAASIGQGSGGDIVINATGELSLQGAFDEGFWTAAIASTVLPVGPDTIGGNSGNVYIHAGDIRIKDGGFIASSTMSIYGKKCGTAGKVTLIVDRHIDISGVNPHGKERVVGSSGIYVYSKERIGDEMNEAGESGDIIIEAQSLSLKNGAKITVSTSGKSNAGKIDIIVDDTLSIQGDSINEPVNFNDDSHLPGGFNYYKSGIYASSFGFSSHTGIGGEISIKAKTINISDKGQIETLTNGGGAAGSIHVAADRLMMHNDTHISSASTSHQNGGPAGMISITSKDVISLMNNSFFSTEAANTPTNNTLNGKISLASKTLYLMNSEITSSVQGGSGNGGNIEIIGSEYIVMNKSKIIANAHEGSGGNIDINASVFIQSSDAIISASSKLGIDGNIEISSPDIEIGSGLNVLPETYLNAEQWVKTPCAYRSGANLSKLIVKKLDASPVVYSEGWPMQTNDVYATSEKIAQTKKQKIDQDIEQYFDRFFFNFVSINN